MSFEEIKKFITDHLGTEAIIGEETSGLQPALIIATEKIGEVCLFLRDRPETYFDFLACLSGVDYGIEAKRFGVVYHLASLPYQSRLTLKVMVEHDRDNADEMLPVVPSLTSIYRTADWHEREAYDLFGIFFSGHPDLRRILLPDDWDGFPLRKDYHTAPEYKGIKIDY